MSTEVLNIGKVAHASGVSAKLIRYYESIGLLPPAVRSESGYRVFCEADVATLRFIRRARNLGFSLNEIELLLGLWRNQSRSSAEVKQLALSHIADLDARIVEMQQMRDTLQNLAACCHGDQRPDCPILEDLAAESN